MKHNKLVEKYKSCFLESYPDILEDLKQEHFFLKSAFHENSRVHAEREGERNVILRILTILDTKLEGGTENG